MVAPRKESQSGARYMNLPSPSALLRGGLAGAVALLQSNMTAGASTAEVPDKPDTALIATGLVLMVVLYLVTGLCAHMDLPED